MHKSSVEQQKKIRNFNSARANWMRASLQIRGRYCSLTFLYDYL